MQKAPTKTKLFVYIDGYEEPYNYETAIPPEQVSLADVKRLIKDCPAITDSVDSYQYYLKVFDVVINDHGRRLITHDESKLEPLKGGRIVVMLIKAHGKPSMRLGSDSGGHESADSNRNSREALLPSRRAADAPLRSITDFARNGRFPGSSSGRGHHSSFHPAKQAERTNGGFETDSTVSFANSRHTSCSDSEYGGSSRASSVSTLGPGDYGSLHRDGRNRQKKFTKLRSNLIRTSSETSVGTSIYSGGRNFEEVRFNREHGGLLGIKLQAEDGMIFVASVMPGCAADNRVHYGDRIIQINEYFVDGYSTEQVKQLLQDLTGKPGQIVLKVEKGSIPVHPDALYNGNYQQYPNNTPHSGFDAHHSPSAHSSEQPSSDSRYGPSSSTDVPFSYQRHPPSSPPFDPIPQWLANTEAVRSVASIAPTVLPGTVLYGPRFLRDTHSSREPLTLQSDPLTVVRRMAEKESGLDVKNRMWLKIEIKDAFMGRNLIKWLKKNVEGLGATKAAKLYATELLMKDLILQTMGTTEFSEQAYYTFHLPQQSEDLYQTGGSLVNHDDMDDIPDSVSQIAGPPGRIRYHESGSGYSIIPASAMGGGGGRRATGSGSGGSGHSGERRRWNETGIPEETASQLTTTQLPLHLSAPNMNRTPSDVTGSRTSFKLAMGRY